MTQRSILLMLILMIFTGGFYCIYWMVVTKIELNTHAHDIPTAWLLIVPFANFYFLYKFARTFTRMILKDESLTVPYFLLFSLLMPIGVLISQSDINHAQGAS